MDILNKQPHKIIICGGNGAGKSTFGRALSQKLGWHFMDIEDYYFPEKNGDYAYKTARTKDEVKKLLLEDMKKYPDFVLASVKGSYGEEIASMFTCAIFVSVPKELRMKRVWDRSYQRYGERILQGGDLYAREKGFFDMVERRSESDVTEWLDSIGIPVIRVDGAQPVEKNVGIIFQALEGLEDGGVAEGDR